MDRYYPAHNVQHISPETADKISGSPFQLISNIHFIYHTVTVYVYYKIVKRNVQATPHWYSIKQQKALIF